jgi:cell wall-associated NlpC family hydrolase
VPTAGPTEASQPLPLRGGPWADTAPLDTQAEDVLMRALGLIGTRYRFGGSHPDEGFDCSGFTGFVFREAAGVSLPRTAREQFAAAGTPVAGNRLQAGDLLFFVQSGRQVDHVGIYLGDGRFVHAPSSGGRVRIDALDSPWWTRSYRGARRVLATP